MIKNYIFLLGLFFTTQMVLGQQGKPIFIPQQIEGANKGRTTTSNVSFYEYPFKSTRIDVRDMKKRYPSLVEEDFVDVISPDLSGFGQVSILMAAVKAHKKDETKLLIWFAGNYKSNSASFFVDEEFDRNYNNDRAPIIVKAGQPKGIKVYPEGKKKRSIELTVSIPKKNKKQLNDQTKPVGKVKSKNSNNVVLGVFAGFGSGSVHHDYLSTVTNFPGWYDATLSEKHLGLSFDKYFKSFKIGARASYQNVFQYTSRFNLRTAEREVTISPNGIRNIRENLNIETNIDEHSSNRFELGLTGALRIHLGPLIELQPTVTAGYLFYSNGQYLANRFENNFLRFDHKKDKFIEVGLEFEMVVGYKKSLSLGVFLNNVDWRPEGFFETIEGENLKRNYRSFSFLLGYKFGL